MINGNKLESRAKGPKNRGKVGRDEQQQQQQQHQQQQPLRVR
ncbi:hypothetical protein e1004f01.tmp0001 [Eimeria tenella]|uniref:Uncharacterized protein n=1 Tax=Eimeria tenella TaxID=5802 RepID=C8TE13_EIMTE|nr:hypothetical protein e1004f01.tmp0001 [Eimeria tenella]